MVRTLWHNVRRGFIAHRLVLLALAGAVLLVPLFLLPAFNAFAVLNGITPAGYFFAGPRLLPGTVACTPFGVSLGLLALIYTNRITNRTHSERAAHTLSLMTLTSATVCGLIFLWLLSITTG